MMKSDDATLAAIAAKSEKESAYHVRHSSEWMSRLGDGTEESHRRAQAAIDDLWAFTGEMFEVDAAERGLIDSGIAVDPAGLRPQWLRTVADVIARQRSPCPKATGCSRAAAAAATASISGICLANCSRCSGRFRVRHGDVGPLAMPICGSARGMPRPRWSIRRFRFFTIADLGVLRGVTVIDGRVEVAITPTYSGCPAMNMIGLEIELALERQGFRIQKSAPCCRRPGPPTG